MINEKCIVPECYIDTIFIESLLTFLFPSFYVSRGVNHQHGCNEVARVMEKSKNLKDSFALGIVDNDKRKPSYLKACTEVYKSDHKHLRCVKHPDKRHFFVVVSPAMEEFIIACADEASPKIDLNELGLSSDLTELKKFTKHCSSKNNPTFKKLFKALIEQNDEIKQFRIFLSRLFENPDDVAREALEK